MSFIINGIFTLFIYLTYMPFIVFFAVWAAVRLRTGKKKKAIEWSIDVTTFFLIFSVSGMIDSIFTRSIGGFWVIVFFMLLLAGIIGNLQTRMRGKIDPKRLFRAVWRITFLILSILYVILFITGVIKYYINL